MGIVVRQSIISSALLYLGAAIGYINILYLFPRYMTLDEIGITRTIQDMAVLMVPLAQFGLTQSMLRFFPKIGPEKRNKAGFLTFMLLLSGVSFIVFMGIYLLVQDQIASYFTSNAEVLIQYFPLVLVITFFLLVYNLLVAYTQSLLKIIAPNFIRYVLLRVMLAFLIIAYSLRWMDFDQFLYGMVSTYTLMTFLITGYLVTKGEFRLSFDFSFLSRKQFRQIMNFTFYSLLGASGMLVIGKIDSLMVTGMLGTSLNGIYTTAFYIAVVIEFPKRAINQISLPLVSRAFERSDLEAVKKLYTQSSINQLIVGGLFLILIWVNLDSIFSLMPKGDSFQAGKLVVLIIGIGRVLDMISGINSEIIVMSKYYRFNMILLGVLAVITILLNLWLIPSYGINGAALGSALALTFFNVSKFIFLRVTYSIQPFDRKTLPVLLLSAVVLIITLSIPDSLNPFADIAVKTTVATGLFLGGALWIKPSEEFMQLMHRAWGLISRREE